MGPLRVFSDLRVNCFCAILYHILHIFEDEMSRNTCRETLGQAETIQTLRKKSREVLTSTVAILNCIRSAGNMVPQTDDHVAGDGRYVVIADDGAQTVRSAAAVAVVAVVVVVRVVRVVLGVPWLPVPIPSVPFLMPVRL
jgi:hypothetical protein